jgi:hypothetical protein
MFITMHEIIIFQLLCECEFIKRLGENQYMNNEHAIIEVNLLFTHPVYFSFFPLFTMILNC